MFVIDGLTMGVMFALNVVLSRSGSRVFLVEGLHIEVVITLKWVLSRLKS